MTSLGKYKLEELIGRGTYAEVYRAVDTVLRRSVALKLLKGAFLSDEEAVARFLQEARTGANLIGIWGNWMGAIFCPCATLRDRRWTGCCKIRVRCARVKR